tara:strand:- start:9926 stop:10918 length:993 start_codon:yes stop_codon:yes gene_type:complete
MTTKTVRGDFITATKCIRTHDLKIDGKFSLPHEPTDGDVLTYHASTDTWKPTAPASASTFPAVVGGTVGDVLTIHDDGSGAKAEWKPAPEELPAIGAVGEILTVTDDGSGAKAEWKPAPEELPATIGAVGEILTVRDDGDGAKASWGTAPGALPAIGAEGEILTVCPSQYSSGVLEPKWKPAPWYVPDFSDAGVNDTLLVQKNSQQENILEWGPPPATSLAWFPDYSISSIGDTLKVNRNSQNQVILEWGPPPSQLPAFGTGTAIGHVLAIGVDNNSNLQAQWVQSPGLTTNQTFFLRKIYQWVTDTYQAGSVTPLDTTTFPWNIASNPF